MFLDDDSMRKANELEKEVAALKQAVADRDLVIEEAGKKNKPGEPKPVETHRDNFWETVEAYGDYITDRAKVPGGWLVCMTHSYGDARAGAPLPNITFVPDPMHTWIYNRNKM